MALTDLIPIPGNINPGVVNAKQATMLSLLGNPRTSYSNDCQSVTNPTLRDLIVVQDVGPFKAQGLRPAVESLTTILTEVAKEQAEVYGALGSAGMLCARLVRGSATSISNHSWGTAIDLTLNGVLDTRGDKWVQGGLAQIAPIFNRNGWYWGAGFRTEDAMHFECGDALIRQWLEKGVIGSTGATGSAGSGSRQILMLGDRGPEVTALQEKLNAHGAQITADGIYGRDTQAAVMAFQSSKGLAVDGVAGAATQAALGKS